MDTKDIAFELTKQAIASNYIHRLVLHNKDVDDIAKIEELNNNTSKSIGDFYNTIFETISKLPKD